MISISKNQVASYAIEIAKWGLVVWLLFPLQSAREGLVNFVRLGAGVVLFVIFAGKLFYDVVYFSKRHESETSTGKDLLSMLGIVIGLSFLALFFILFIALHFVDALEEIRF